jgi:hypothetical protein
MLCMHASVRAMLRVCVSRRAYMQTTGLYEQLKLAMPLMEAFLEVALALFDTVYNIRRIVCFGTQALQVHVIPRSQKSGVCSTCFSFVYACMARPTSSGLLTVLHLIDNLLCLRLN